MQQISNNKRLKMFRLMILSYFLQKKNYFYCFIAWAEQNLMEFPVCNFISPLKPFSCFLARTFFLFLSRFSFYDFSD